LEFWGIGVSHRSPASLFVSGVFPRPKEMSSLLFHGGRWVCPFPFERPLNMSAKTALAQDLQSSAQGKAKEKSLPPSPSGIFPPQAKILYLLGVAVSVLIVREPIFNASLLCLQGILWLSVGVDKRDLNILKKGLPFALAIFLVNSFFTSPRDFTLFSLFNYSVAISSAGFIAAATMAGRLFTILLASMVVRKSMSSEGFIDGLVRLKLSKNFALILDSILSSLEGKGPGSGKGQGKGRGKGQGKEKKAYRLKSILKGDFYIIIELINRRLTEAKEKFADYDWAVICAISVMVAGIRMIKILPGIPIAPGHKNVIIIPLFILVATLSRKKFAATYVGFLSGVISFMLGFGKYGLLGIAQFMVPGFDMGPS